MKFKKILFYICVVLAIFVIYKITFNGKINYVALGDSLAKGINPYGEAAYGYTDYIADYLSKNNLLDNYVKEYTKSNYKISDLVNDINNNKSVIHNETYINIKSTLRESDLITLSIGINDFLDELTVDNLSIKLKDNAYLKNKINEISSEFNDLLVLIKKYAKGDIIVIGYYNPFPYEQNYKEDLDKLIKYLNSEYSNICQKNNVYFVDVFQYFDNRTDYLPNPLNKHPNVLGYNEIFNQVKKVLDKRVIK
ncbi:MAG: SGNH/GDSL hydrolase family protein [Bacilli bacterium]